MYRVPLGQRQLTEIYANYLPLYKANLIDEIFLVTDKGLSPSAQAMCLEIRDSFYCLAALGEQPSDKLLEKCLLLLANRRVVGRHSKKKRRGKSEVGEEVVKERTTEPLLDSFFGHLGIDYKSGRILLGEASSFIVSTLRNYCFLEDWITGIGPSSSTLRLRGVVNTSPDVVEAIRRRPGGRISVE